jgi:hypothetical protein
MRLVARLRIRIPVISGSKAVDSWRCTPVVTREIGRQQVSAER